MRTRRRGGLALGVALLAIAVAMVCCGRGDRKVNLVIIGVDTLRPDHLSCYGYDRATSPAIDKLAADGTLFEHAVSPSSWTLPSFASLMTSLYPHQHGALHRVTEIGEGFPTLAAILAENGYATGALVNAAVLSPETKFNRGFAYYDPPGPEPRLADGTTADALAWMDENRGKPFFLFLHYYDPHMPYQPPAPYDTLFDVATVGRIGRSFNHRDYLPDEKGAPFEHSVTPEEWRHINALYDGEIVFTDRAIGGLLEGLAERRLRDRTLIVLISDHGEEFYEHRGYGHGHTLYGEVINVPLILALPGAIPAGARIAQQVRTIDVMPTILDVLGVRPAGRFEGVSLLPLITGRGGLPAGAGQMFPPSFAYSEGILHGWPKASITASPWKLILDVPLTKEGFFNIGSDPGELVNLAADKPGPYLELSAALARVQIVASDTWYLEMAAGDAPHTFDAEVTAKAGLLEGTIYLHKLIDGTGAFIAEEPPIQVETSAGRLRVAGLTPRDPVTLAFKVEAPPAVPLTFDLQIDGKRAAQRTFVGEALNTPGEMPFIKRVGKMAHKGLNVPTQRPAAPYFLLWRAAGRQASQTPAALTEEARRELRALGYIQ